MSRMKSNKGLNLYPLFHKFTALLLMQGSRLFNPSQAIPMQRVWPFVMLYWEFILHCKLYTEKLGVWAGESGSFVRGKSEFRLGKVPVSLVQSRELCNWQEIRQIEKRPQKETNNEFIWQISCTMNAFLTKGNVLRPFGSGRAERPVVRFVTVVTVIFVGKMLDRILLLYI